MKTSKMYKTFWYFKIDVKLVWKVWYKQKFNIQHLKTTWPNKYCPIKNKWVDSYNLKEQQHLSPNYSSLLEQMSPKLSWGHQIIADEDNRTLKLATSSLISKTKLLSRWMINKKYSLSFVVGAVAKNKSRSSWAQPS